jgi:hypothetical protein
MAYQWQRQRLLAQPVVYPEYAPNFDPYWHGLALGIQNGNEKLQGSIC